MNGSSAINDFKVQVFSVCFVKMIMFLYAYNNKKRKKGLRMIVTLAIPYCMIELRVKTMLD